MKTLKAYTDLEQSKKLAKILPLESADMYWDYDVQKHEYYPMVMDDQFDDTCICAWSLSALLDILPKDESIDCTITFGYYNSKVEYIEKWLCAFEKECETTDDFIIETTDGINPIDACVDMIMKLHELKLL